MNNVIVELEKRIANRYELIDDGLKDIISSITEILSTLESVRYLEFIKRKFVENQSEH